MSRNEHATSLHVRAGNAGVAVSVDTRPKVIPNKRRRGAQRSDVKRRLRKGTWE
jgi:hypothetical protein